MTEINKGTLEVGTTGKGEIVINHPDLEPDENGVGHIVFSVNQANNLAVLLQKKAAEAGREIGLPVVTSEIDDVLYMPGTFRCNKCNFQLQACILDATTGQVRVSTRYEPEACPNDGEPMERVTWESAFKDSAKQQNDLIIALAESLKLQSHYAGLLNSWDGGGRMQFACPADWMNRLVETGTLQR